MDPILDGQPRVDGKLFTARANELRAVYREAYMAALTGCMSVEYCHTTAIETVRQWPAMQAELEKEITE